jgi:hypothetical protein
VKMKLMKPLPPLLRRAPIEEVEKLRTTLPPEKPPYAEAIWFYEQRERRPEP